MTYRRASCPESKINARPCVISTRYLVRSSSWHRKHKPCFMLHDDTWWKCPALCVKMKHNEYHTYILWFLKLGSRLTMKAQRVFGTVYEEMHTNKIDVCFWMRYVTLHSETSSYYIVAITKLFSQHKISHEHIRNETISLSLA